jgi:hypothetical protein
LTQGYRWEMICQFTVSIARTPKTQNGTSGCGTAKKSMRQLVQYCKPLALAPLLTNWKQCGQLQRTAMPFLELERGKR